MSPILRAKRTFKMKHTRGAVRQVTCDEFGCKNRKNGWMIVLPVPLHQDTVDFIRNGGTRRQFVEKIESEGMVTFYFHSGQDCFDKHISRDPLFDIRRNDSNGGSLLYPDGDAFVWDSDTHLRKIKRVVEG